MAGEMNRTLLRKERIVKGNVIVWKLTFYNWRMEQVETVIVEDIGITLDIKNVGIRNGI